MGRWGGRLHTWEGAGGRIDEWEEYGERIDEWNVRNGKVRWMGRWGGRLDCWEDEGGRLDKCEGKGEVKLKEMRVGRYVGWKLNEKQDEKRSERSLKEG